MQTGVSRLLAVLGIGGLLLLNAGSALAASFADLGGYPWAANSVEQLAAQGVVSGVGNGLYDPSGSLTQEQAITMLMHVVAGGEAGSSGGGAGSGVSSWALPWVGLAVQKGILLPSDNFQALAPASRVQVIVWLVRALGLSAQAKLADTATLDFKDTSSIPAADLGSVALAVGAGLIAGEGNGYLDPLGIVNRAQMAVILSKAEAYVALHGTPGQATLEEHNSVTGNPDQDLITPGGSFTVGSVAAGNGQVVALAGKLQVFVNTPYQPVGSGTPFVITVTSRTTDVSGQETGQWDAVLGGGQAPSLAADGHLSLTAAGGSVSGTYSDGGSFSGTLTMSGTSPQPGTTTGSGTYQETDRLASGQTLNESVQFKYTDAGGSLSATWTRTLSDGIALQGSYSGPDVPLPVLWGAADLMAQGVASGEAALNG
ncbi:MAG: S-layer homology domain-containing protein [Thermaerobacter sp.]|nr:S-layer homology domain-containing protein [Thermaerobacter sp.]